MILNHLIAMTFAYIIDLIIGDPKNLPHPVRLIGSVIAYVERRWNNGNFRKWKGILTVVLTMGLVMSITVIVTVVAYEIHRWVGIGLEAILIASTIATKGLADAAYDVYRPLKQKNVDLARQHLSRIVGRDTEKLTEAEMTRATVETVAENTSDGITAPLLWAFIGGAPLALAYRAINTCDSMLGYKNARYAQFGWASARLDDVVNYIPSRLSGFLMVLVNKPVPPLTKRHCFRILFRDAKKHASPNSGWLEAAMAALLGVQLGGANTYNGIVSKGALIGEQHVPLQKQQIVQATSIMHRTVISMLVLCWLGGGWIAFARSWCESTTLV